MPIHDRRRAALALLVAAFALPTAFAHPYPRADLEAVGLDYLLARDCATYCGADDQYCCGSGETCFTSGNIAGCSATNGDGAHGVYVTTWTQTQTFTSTISTSWAPVITDAGGDCVPADDTETSCGSVCCASWQYCAYKGQCYANDKSSVPVSTFTTDGQLTTQFSQAYRVTSTTGATATGTAAAGTAGDNNNGGDDGAGGGGLSGGAIAGIVVGSLIGLALLMLLCFCCIARGLWGLLCGRRGDKDSDRSTTVVTENRYGRGRSAHSHRETHRTWYGARVASPSGRRNSSSGAAASGGGKKKSENKLLLAVTAVFSTLAALLFLKRKKKSGQQSEKSRSTATARSRSRAASRSRGYTDSWTGSDSDRTSTTEPSNYTRRTRDTRGTRHSRRPRDRDY